MVLADVISALLSVSRVSSQLISVLSSSGVSMAS